MFELKNVAKACWAGSLIWGETSKAGCVGWMICIGLTAGKTLFVFSKFKI